MRFLERFSRPESSYYDCSFSRLDLLWTFDSCAQHSQMDDLVHLRLHSYSCLSSRSAASCSPLASSRCHEQAVRSRLRAVSPWSVSGLYFATSARSRVTLTAAWVHARRYSGPERCSVIVSEHPSIARDSRRRAFCLLQGIASPVRLMLATTSPLLLLFSLRVTQMSSVPYVRLHGAPSYQFRQAGSCFVDLCCISAYRMRRQDVKLGFDRTRGKEKRNAPRRSRMTARACSKIVGPAALCASRSVPRRRSCAGTSAKATGVDVRIDARAATKRSQVLQRGSARVCPGCVARRRLRASQAKRLRLGTVCCSSLQRLCVQTQARVRIVGFRRCRVENPAHPGGGAQSRASEGARDRWLRPCNWRVAHR